MKSYMKKGCMVAVIATVICLFGPIIHAEAADWAFSTQDGKKKPLINGTITLCDNECLDMNIYRNRKEIDTEHEQYIVKWYSSDSDIVYVDKKTGEMEADKFGKMSEDIGQAKITAVIKNRKSGSMTKKCFNVRVLANGLAIPETPKKAFRYRIENEEVMITGLKDKSLTEIRIPDIIEGYPVTRIGVQAFFECKNLNSIIIPVSVTNIGWWAFDETPWFEYQKKNNDYVVINDILLYWVPASAEGAFVIPDNIKYIEDEAFAYCEEITSIVIPDSVIDIGSHAFANCESLTSINIPNGITCIEYGTFSGCNSLTSIVIPDSVTSIEESAFYDCSSLTDIVIPDSVWYIGENAFCRCDSLVSVKIPDSVSAIKGYAFSDCESLISIEIPNTITRIGENAFMDCKNLKNIIIPDSVVSMEYGVFRGCTGLNRIELPSGLKTIKTWMFWGCSSLSSVSIPDSVTKIENEIFLDCNNLSEIIVAEGSYAEQWAKENGYTDILVIE